MGAQTAKTRDNTLFSQQVNVAVRAVSSLDIVRPRAQSSMENSHPLLKICSIKLLLRKPEIL